MNGSTIGTLVLTLVLAAGLVGAAELCDDPEDVACFETVREAVDASFILGGGYLRSAGPATRHSGSGQP